jgi:hypothetical protein
MIEKKDNKLSIVDTDIKESINRLLNEIKHKFLISNDSNQDNTPSIQQNTTNENNNENNNNDDD